jgi:hypothetical protein
MLQRLYAIKPVQVYGELEILKNGRQYLVASQGQYPTDKSTHQHAFRVINPQPIGIINPNLLPETVTLILPKTSYVAMFYDVPFTVDTFVPTDEFADPDQGAVDGFYFAREADHD